MDSEAQNKSSNIVIRIWNNLSIQERQELKIRALAYFPELFGKNNDKFGRVGIWLVTREAVVCSNVRDIFTAGGKSNVLLGNYSYKNIPRILINLFENIEQIAETIIQTPSNELTEFWKNETSERTKLFDWIEIVSKNAMNILDPKDMDISKVLQNYFQITK